MKTAKEVQSDFLDMMRKSEIAKHINGKVYRSGYRPKDSQKEDLTVAFIEGLTNQIEKGVVNINIYVPRIAFQDRFLENGKRTAEIERLCASWLEEFDPSKTEYLIELQSTIKTFEMEEVKQDFVNMRLKYQRFNN